MIVAIANSEGRSLKLLLTANLAVLRASHGHEICLIDTDPRKTLLSWACNRSSAGQAPSVTVRSLTDRLPTHEFDKLGPVYGDLLINTGEHDQQETLWALIGARVVIVPLTVDQVDLDMQYSLIARLNSARMFNPALKVLFVFVADGAAPSADQLAAVWLYVAHVMSATLATTVLQVHGTYDYGLGRYICDAETCDPDIVAQLHSLYREVYLH